MVGWLNQTKAMITETYTFVKIAATRFRIVLVTLEQRVL